MTSVKFLRILKEPLHYQSYSSMLFGISFQSILSRVAWSSIINENETGTFVTLKHETQQKIRQGGLALTARAVEWKVTQRRECMPLLTVSAAQSNFLLKKKTEESATSLFNQYYKNVIPQTDKWFAAQPLSTRTFSKFLTEICKAAGVETIYNPLVKSNSYNSFQRPWIRRSTYVYVNS